MVLMIIMFNCVLCFSTNPLIWFLFKTKLNNGLNASRCCCQPATVSRCGMIYLEPITLGWRPLMTSWINALPQQLTEEHSQVIVDVFEWLIEPCVTFVHKNCKVSWSWFHHRHHHHRHHHHHHHLSKSLLADIPLEWVCCAHKDVNVCTFLKWPYIE